MASDAFEKKLAELEQKVADVERRLSGDDLDAARSLVRTLLDVHRDALEELLAAPGASEALLRGELARRRKVSWLFGLHGLNPRALSERASEALGLAVASLASSASAELVAVAGERVDVRIRGGAAEARTLLARAVERAMLGLAPEAELALDVEPEAPAAPVLLAPERLVRRRAEPLP
jgi:hypothetical protein